MRRFVLITSVVMSACATVHVDVPVMKPAEINMGRYKQIAVGELRGQHGQEIMNLVQQHLMESNRFQVVDRAHLGQIMGELKLSASELADPNHAAQLGKQLPASALLFGNVEEDDFQNNETFEDRKVADAKGNTHVQRYYTRVGTATVRVSFQIDDVETGQLLKVKRVEKRAQQRRFNDCAQYSNAECHAPSIDGSEMLRQEREEVVAEFMRAIVPHRVVQEASFYKDGDLPELERAIAMCKLGEWAKAQDLVSTAIDRGEKSGLASKIIAKAYWDRGLVYEYSGQYDKAKADVQKAYEYTSDDDFLKELAHIEQAATDAKKLQEQNATAGVSGS